VVAVDDYDKGAKVEEEADYLLLAGGVSRRQSQAGLLASFGRITDVQGQLVGRGDNSLRTWVGEVVLVAPWIDPNKKITTGMFDFNINKEIVWKTKGITIFESTDDEYVEVEETISILQKEVIDLKIITFKNHGHFCLRHMHTREFPELLEECLK
jgi:hypothetical protein